MAKKGLVIPPFRPKNAHPDEPAASPSKPQFKDLVEEAKWEEEQRMKQVEAERKAVSATFISSPGIRRTNSGFQGMSPIVPKTQVAAPMKVPCSRRVMIGDGI